MFCRTPPIRGRCRPTEPTGHRSASASSYTPTEADEGKALRLVVTYAGDAAGSESTIVSAGSVQEIAAGDLVATLDGLTGGNAVQDAPVSVTAVTDNGTDVLSGATYQWQVLNGATWTDISGATGSTYTPLQADEDKALRVVVTYAGDAAGSESTTVSAGIVQDTAGGDLFATLGGLTGGNAVQGAVVNVTTVTHAGADVLSSATYSWQVSTNGRDLDRHFGATGATYTPTEADEGKALRVVVTYTDESTTVSAGVIQEKAAGDLVGDARRTDERQRGAGHVRQRDGGDGQRSQRSVGRHLLSGRFRQRNRLDTGSAHGSSYTPTEADEGKALRLVVTYAGDAAGSESTIVSAGTVQEIAAGDLAATLGGLTTGNAVQGTAVSVTAVTDNGTNVLSGATYSWQVSTNGTDWPHRVGTGVSYTPTEADEGKALRVVVTYAGDAAGSESTIVSAGVIQEIAAGDLVGDARRTDARQRGPGYVRHRDGGDGRWSRRSVGRYLLVAGVDERNRLDTGRHRRELHADRGRRRQGAAAGGDLCRRCGGELESTIVSAGSDAGDRGWRSCGDARRTDRAAMRSRVRPSA